jgi:hypothetical protein
VLEASDSPGMIIRLSEWTPDVGVESLCRSGAAQGTSRGAFGGVLRQ